MKLFCQNFSVVLEQIMDRDSWNLERKQYCNKALVALLTDYQKYSYKSDWLILKLYVYSIDLASLKIMEIY